MILVQVRSPSKGDTRGALTPFLAFKQLGDTFQWLFLGEDDTLFFVDAARNAVASLDPDMPIFLTGDSMS